MVLYQWSSSLPHFQHLPQTYLQRTAPHPLRSRSPVLRRIAMTTKHICWQPLHNQTSPVDTSVGLLRGGGGDKRQEREQEREGKEEGQQMEKLKRSKEGQRMKTGRAK